MPAEVQIGAVDDEDAVLFDATLGKRPCISRAKNQCVVARRSSSKPASASMKRRCRARQCGGMTGNALQRISAIALDDAAGSRMPATNQVSNAGWRSVRVSIDTPMDFASPPRSTSSGCRRAFAGNEVGDLEHR